MNNTLLTGLALLEKLAHSDRPLGITELAEKMGLGKSHVHRLLQGLLEAGYARRDARTGSYAASTKFWELGVAVLGNIDLRRVAEPVMEHLLEVTRETVHLSILDGDEVVYMHKLDSPEPVRAYSKVGGRAPAYAVATGKAILANQTPAVIEALSQRLVRFTPKTITDRDAFLREMRLVRQRGYALNRGEWRETVGGIGAVVHDSTGAVAAAIGLSGPIERFRPSGLKVMIAHVIEAADRITTELGGRSGQVEQGASNMRPGNGTAARKRTLPRHGGRPTRKSAR